MKCNWSRTPYGGYYCQLLPTDTCSNWAGLLQVVSPWTARASIFQRYQGPTSMNQTQKRFTSCTWSALCVCLTRPRRFDTKLCYVLTQPYILIACTNSDWLSYLQRSVGDVNPFQRYAHHKLHPIHFVMSTSLLRMQKMIKNHPPLM